MSKKQECDHFVGYIGEDEKHAELIRASEHYTFGDFAAEGQKFDFCPFCGQRLKWTDPEAE